MGSESVKQKVSAQSLHCFDYLEICHVSNCNSYDSLSSFVWFGWKSSIQYGPSFSRFSHTSISFNDRMWTLW